MIEKVITVKDCKRIEKGESWWYELIDQENKKHRVFKTVKEGDVIHDLSDKIDSLKDAANRTLKLKKFQVDKFWNVADFEFVTAEQARSSDAPSKIEMTKDDWSQKEKMQRQSIEAQVAFKGIVELIIADKINKEGNMAACAYAWALTKIGAPPEFVKSAKETPPDASKSKSTGIGVGVSTKPSPIDLDWLQESMKIIKWTQATLTSWIKNQGWGVDTTGTIAEVIGRLNEAQAKVLFTHISEVRALRESK